MEEDDGGGGGGGDDDDDNTSVQWRVWAEISLLAPYFRQTVMATLSLSQGESLRR